MHKSIYDVIGKKFDIEYEYLKLYDLFYNADFYEYKYTNYSLAEIFNIFIEEWKYRATYRNVDEIFADFDLDEETNEVNVLRDILYLIDIILNINAFIEYMMADLENQYYNFKDSGVSRIYKYSNMINENIEILLKELGYRIITEEEYKIKILKDNADAIITATMVNDNKLEDLIINYIDFRIEKDLDAKKEILNNFAQYLEPLRKDIKSANSSLENYIFLCFNNLHIRHNNKIGSKTKDYVTSMGEEELLFWYDKVYNLILIAIRLINLPNEFNEFNELKKKIELENNV